MFHGLTKICEIYLATLKFHLPSVLIFDKKFSHPLILVWNFYGVTEKCKFPWKRPSAVSFPNTSSKIYGGVKFMQK